MVEFLRCKNRLLDLRVPQVMGILNVTPDSFSDGGRYVDQVAALNHARQMVSEGASIIDVGGESTRPGAAVISVDEEASRVVPVIEAIVAELPVVVSVDTSRPEVMQAAIAAGAGMINDVRALREPGALKAAASCDIPVCLMHMLGQPRTMQQAPHYEDVVSEVKQFLADRMNACVDAGIDRDLLIIDPGYGFGKTLSHNMALLRNLAQLLELDAPLLVGLSRKTMIGTLTDAPVDERVYGSLAAATIACWQGAHIIRVHDVLPTVQALKVCRAVKEES